MSFNELLTEAGDFGLYQKLLCLGFLWSSITLAVLTYWTNVFILLVGPHRCRLSPNDTWDNDVTQYHNIVVGQCDIRFNGTWGDNFLGSEDSDPYHPVEEYENSTWTTIPCPYGWVYDFSTFYPTISTEKDWVCEDAWKMYILHTWYWAGNVCGFAFFGIFSDRYGRKRSYQACLFLTLISDVSAIFAKTRTGFTIARFFSAMGRASIPTLSFVLAMEYTGPRKRLLVLGGWGITWTVMGALIPVIPYLLRYWKWILAAPTVPYTIVLLFSNFVPESASWLITKGRLDEASKLIQRLSSVNGRKLDLHYIKEKLEAQSKESPHVANGTQLTDAVPNGNPDKKAEDERHLSEFQAILGLFKTPNMRKKTILLVILWTIACMCYNGNNIAVSNLPFNLYLSYSIGALLELPANICCILTLDRIGRRWGNFGFLVLAGSLGIASGLLQTDSRIVLVLALLMRTGLAGSYDTTFTFSSESFPTEVRGRAVSLIRIFGAVGSCVAPFIASLSAYYPLLPLVVFGVLTLFAAVLTLFVPETAKQHLPHTIEEGEEYGKDQRFFFCPFSQKTRRATPSISGDLQSREEENKNFRGRENLAMEKTE